jgi:hypothetical protein
VRRRVESSKEGGKVREPLVFRWTLQLGKGKTIVVVVKSEVRIELVGG